MEKQGKVIILLGLIIVVAGIIVWLMGDKLRWIGRLPGDIHYERGNMRVFIPITTMLLASILLSLIFLVVHKIGK